MVKRLMRDAGGSAVGNARKCITPTSRTALVCIEKVKSSCRCMKWSGWLASSEGRGLLAIREKHFMGGS